MLPWCLSDPILTQPLNTHQTSYKHPVDWILTHECDYFETTSEQLHYGLFLGQGKSQLAVGSQLSHFPCHLLAQMFQSCLTDRPIARKHARHEVFAQYLR